MKRFLAIILSSGSLILMCVILNTCKKDPEIVPYPECENFPKPTGIHISIVTQKPSQKRAPYFNPNNSSEFIYIKREYHNESLVKFNMVTKVEQVLLSNSAFVCQPKWSKNGWIVFVKLDLQIYLMKDNGDSIRKITHYFENLYPSFLGNDKILFSVGTETSPGAAGNKIIDLFGKRIDSIKVKGLGSVFGISDVNSTQTIASMLCSNSVMCSVSIFDTNFINPQSIYDFQFAGRNEITGIAWHPNNKDVYFSTFREGMYKVNINTKELEKIRNGCDSRSYRFLSISPDGASILVERVDATDYTINPGSWTEQSNIYIMDITGNNERKVFE